MYLSIIVLNLLIFLQFYKANKTYVYQPAPNSQIKLLKNDLGIILVEKPIEFNERVKPACLPKTEITFGSTCYASGWGNIKQIKSSKPEELIPVNATYLMTAPLNIFNKSECYQELLQHNENAPYEKFELLYDELIPGGICASNRPKSTCKGDSGGPFICEENGKAVVRGVVSGSFDFNYGLYLELFVNKMIAHTYVYLQFHR